MTTPPRPFGYSRFSNEDLQDEKSITDQQRSYGTLADKEAPGHQPIRHFSDEGISGADPMITRPQLQAMLRGVAAGECDGFLFAESTDRLSRDAADLHTIYKLVTFHGVRIFTVEEGEVTDMIIGIKAVVNQQFLKGLGVKTRRGEIGVFKRGRWPSRIPFGYRSPTNPQLERDKRTGEMVRQRGVLEIDPITSMTVRQILEWYDAGLSGEAIAKRLNALGTPSPSNSTWGPSTINGNWRRGTGILNNTLYIGQGIYNRQRFQKDPTHVPLPGKKPRRVARRNAASEWEHQEFQHLRIIDDALWQRVKARQEIGRVRLQSAGSLVRQRRPLFMFSGLTKCGQCGAGFNLYSRSELRCYAKTKMGPTVCTNSRTITRHELEGRVLNALKGRFLADPVAFEEFCAGFREAQNQDRMQQRGRIAVTKREFDRVTRDIQRVIDAILAGISGVELKAKMEDLQSRKTALFVEMASLEAPEPLLHPSMGDLYRTKVENLAAALDTGDEIERERAKDTLRGFIEKIVIPADEQQPLRVFGDLGKMLAAAANGADASALSAVAQGGCGGGI
jgi:site-specific DNA recombinase